MRKKPKQWTSAAARRLIAMAGNPPTVEQAVGIVATRLLDGVPCPPTELDVLQTRLNVRSCEPVAGLPVSGELRKEGEALKIVYSASLSRGRKRFTIAHELGHAVFETTGPNCPKYGQELERICDMLASEFLLPRRIFSEHAGPSIDATTVYKLARLFDASLMATALRCWHLFGVSVFQVEDARVAWGYGVIREQRHIQANAAVFQTAIASAMEGTAGERMEFLNGAEYILQWTCPPGRRHALFVLRPVRAVPGNGQFSNLRPR